MPYGLAAGFRGSDGVASHAVSIPASAAISSLSTMSLWFWCSSPNVSNTLRNIAGKSVSGPGGWELFRRGVDGTQLQLSRYRNAGQALTIQSPTGTLRANVPQFVFITADLSSSANCKMWVGTLDTPAASVTTTVSIGSGAGASDSAQAVIVGNGVAGSAGWPGMIWSFGMSSAIDFTLDEVRRLQFNLTPSAARNVTALWVFDRMPAGNLAGGGEIAALTGTGRLSSNALPRVRRRDVVA